MSLIYELNSNYLNLFKMSLIYELNSNYLNLFKTIGFIIYNSIKFKAGIYENIIYGMVMGVAEW